MAKLYFRYGAMNSGKSTSLLQAAYNYEERGQHVLLAKPAIDTKGASEIASRLGVTREVDFLIGPGDNARTLFAEHRERIRRSAEEELIPSGPVDVACLLIDEAQFLTPEQVDDLFRIAIEERIPVMAYGIRNDFLTHAFPGSARLLAIAHSLEELKTICRCGRKAVFNGRVIGGRFVFDGDQVAIDEGADGSAAPELTTYESLCGTCYLEESGGRLG
ncbi:thymidine kinase [Microbacterium luteolum]|uniref:Thymidine kinase n=1 Tax=Microbacterium luteolum TaxID=69367 RepID=A0ABY7XK40_MICLT|nr:thymidine kinase [Microbacterium luteolum]WDM42459.1 thymidine kinase [Microbacterium luteolum]